MVNERVCPEFIEKSLQKNTVSAIKIPGNNNGYCIVESHRRIYDRPSHLPESIATEYKDCFFSLHTEMGELLKTDKQLRMNSRLFLLIAMGMMSAFGPFVTDFYLPGLPALAAWFGTTTSWVQLSLTTSMIGLSGGQLIIGPLSDKYGRRGMLLISMALFIVSTVACLFSWNIESFVFFRVFQGIAGAGGVVISKSVAADLYQGKELADFFSLLMVINGLAPIIAPVVGGFVMKYTNWQGIFAILLGIGIILFFVSLVFRESLPKERRIAGSIFNSFGNFIPIMKNGRFMNYVWVQMFGMGVFFTYLASSPFLIQEYFHLDAFMYSLCFAINASGMIVGSRLASRFTSVFRALSAGVYGLVVSCLFFVAVLVFGWSFYLLEIMLFLIMLALGMILPTSTSLALTLERSRAGSASAIIGFFLFIFGAIVSPLTGFADMIISVSVMTLICCGLSLIFLLVAGKRFDSTR